MKNILRLIILLNISLGWNSLSAQESVPDKSKTRTIRLDPATAHGGSMSQVYSEITYIPLETNKESLFGDITQLEVTEKNFIIFDSDTKTILIFDRSGKYISKINILKLIGRGAVSAQDIDVHGFSIKEQLPELIINVPSKNQIYSFDINGKQIAAPTSRKSNYPTQEFTFRDSIRVVSYYQDKIGKDRNIYNYAFLKDDKPFAKYFPIDTSKYSKMGDFAVGGSSLIETDDSQIFNAVQFYDYTIYQITNKGMSAVYSFVFPAKNTVPADFNTTRLYLGKKLNYFFKNSEKIFGIGYTYKIGDFLYFKCGSLNAELRKNGSFVYDLKNDYLISLNRLDIDSNSHYLPVIGTWDNDFKKYDGNYLFASLSSLEMFNFYELDKSKKHIYPKSMQDYFKKGTKKDNPIIIQLKPKK